MCRDANGAGAGRTLSVGMGVRGFQPGKHQQKQDAHPRDPAAGLDLDPIDHLPLDVRMILAEPGRDSGYPKGATSTNTEVPSNIAFPQAILEFRGIFSARLDAWSPLTVIQQLALVLA